MIRFEQLNSQEQNRIHETGLNWYRQHKDHVLQLIKHHNLENSGNGPKIAPSGSDLFHPELWKPSHWKWFLDNHFLL